MIRSERRHHRHFRILFIDLDDLWNRLCEGRQASNTTREAVKPRFPSPLLILTTTFLGGFLACGGGSSGNSSAPAPTAPRITAQPANLTVTEGSNGSFTVAASGNPSPTFTWERSGDGGSTWAAVGGATSATYTFTAHLSDNAAQFRAKAINSVETATSGAAMLNVNAAVPITFQIPDISRPGSHVGLDMLPLPAGTFTMGSSDRWDLTGQCDPPHQVSISTPFYMAKFECTQALWMALMGTNPSHFSLAGGGCTTDDLTRPVDTVSYEDITTSATGFLEKLNAATASLRPAGLIFRLPTEAEWEYACRAGTTTGWSFGEDGLELYSHAWIWDNSGLTTHPVGTKLPNPWGLYDMHGNALEWCQDWFGPYSDAPQIDPVGPSSGTYRVARGGSYFFSYYTESTHSAYRYWVLPTIRDQDNGGFRVVLALPRHS